MVAGNCIEVAHTLTHKHTHICTHIHTYIHTHTHTHTHICTHTHTYIHTYTHTNTHFISTRIGLLQAHTMNVMPHRCKTILMNGINLSSYPTLHTGLVSYDVIGNQSRHNTIIAID